MTAWGRRFLFTLYRGASRVSDPKFVVASIENLPYITRRDYFAGIVLRALLPSQTEGRTIYPTTLAEAVVTITDTVLEKLDEKK
mgnify:CR=1 FL=1